MPRYYFFTISFLSCFFLPLLLTGNHGGAAYAQKQGKEWTDSLQIVLQKNQQDTNRINALNELSTANLGYKHYDTAIYLAQNALQLAQKLNYKNGIADAYHNIGNIHKDQSNYPDAIKHYSAALKIYESIEDKYGIADCYNNIGVSYVYQGNYPEALKNQLAALKIFESIGDKNKTAGCYNNLGVIYGYQSDYPEALKNYTAALKIYASIGDKKRIASAYMNAGIIYSYQGNYPEALKNHLAALKIQESLGNKSGIANCYTNIGIVYGAQENYTEAVKNYTAALKIHESIDNKTGIANCYANIGDSYLEQHKYPEALKNLTAAKKIYESIGNKDGIAIIYSGIGKIYGNQGNYPEALKSHTSALRIYESTGAKDRIATSYNDIGNTYVQLNKAQEGSRWLQKGLELSKAIGAISHIQKSYSGLAAADSALGNFKSAFENYKLSILYQDSLKNEENTKKLTQAEMHYEFDKKEALAKAEQEKKDILARAALAKAKNNQNLALAGVGVFMLAATFLGIGFYQKRKSNHIISKEKQKSDELLLNILPEEIAEELKEKGHAEARQFDSVTVLFTDFVDFTKAGERMTPKELVEEIDTCFKAFDSIIDKYNIEKIKTIGDAYLAVCGLPNADNRHAQHILNAALEIKTFMAERKLQKGDKTFAIRIGVHSGSVVAGIVGVKKFAYDIWGDTVNTAARMEQNSEADKINISETTYQLVKQDFSCSYRGEIEAKNKGMLRMYFVNGKL